MNKLSHFSSLWANIRSYVIYVSYDVLFGLREDLM